MRYFLLILLFPVFASAQVINPKTDSAIIILKRVNPLTFDTTYVHDTVKINTTTHDTIRISTTIHDTIRITSTIHDTIYLTSNPPPPTGNSGNASVVSTFNSIGLYWSGVGNSSTVCNVKYRSADSVWHDGLPLWYDSRKIGDRPAGEYRGSIVYLNSGTKYEIKLTAATATNTIFVNTWSEVFPTGQAVALTTSTTINTSGTKEAYRLYTGNISGGSNNLIINASYIIIRGMTLTGATNDAIVLGANAHDVIIEECDISGWGQSASTLGGNDQAAVRVQGFSYNASGVQRIVIQRNKIHDPRYTASAWDAGNTHPYGVNGINFENAGGNQVIRYNSFYSSTPDKRFMDGIGGADNFTTAGFPGANSDIYGNSIDGTYDDAIEAEGSGCNVRVWGNWMNNVFTGVATATVSVGPIYVFNNITNVGQRLVYGTSNSTLDNEDRGPFNKCGSQDATVRGGRAYLFHNTVLQPKQAGFNNPRGLCGGIVDNGGAVTNIVSKNNIWTSAYTSKGGLPIAMWQGGGQNCTSENDLLSPNSTTGTFTIINRITGNPVYTSSVPLTLDPLGYYLSSTSPGKGKAVAIPNFNKGAGSDIGAQQSGDPVLQYGVNAYK